MSTTANPLTEKASRYLQQLCKHWSHKFTVEFDAEKGSINLPFGRVNLEALAENLVVTLHPEEGADVAKMKSVVEDHINRFAFREAPLNFDWSA